MSGFQFTRFEVYARQCPKESRKDGRTADEVLDENARKPGNMPHVSRPEDPKLLYGVSVDEVRKMHDQVENATTTLKNGRPGKSGRRKIPWRHVSRLTLCLGIRYVATKPRKRS